jgi:hypothetical protein
VLCLCPCLVTPAFVAFRLLHVLYAPPPHQASIATFCFQPNRVPVFAFVCLYLFPCICFWFSLYLLLFSAASLVFFGIVFLCCFFECFFGFVCNSTDLIQACFAALRPLTVPFFAPPPRQASNAPFIVRVWLECDRLLFPCNLFIFLLVISLVSIDLLLSVMLGPSLWVVNVNIILAFRSKMTSFCLGFSALSANELLLPMH